jgi:tetratricopeptide (TPR) repeat protein
MIAALNIDSSKSVYYMTISDLYFLGNKTGKSKLALERAISLDAKNVDAMLKLAELYLYVAKHDKSIEYINMALKVDMYNSKGYFMKGMNYKELKDTAKAISSMQTAVEQDQQYYQAFMQLGILCAAQKNSLAVQYYKNAIRLNPKSTEAIYGLGKYYQDIEDYANALTTYKSILDYEQNPNVHYNIGAIHLGNTRKYDLALTHFSDVIKIDPKYTDAYFARGVTYEKMGNKKSAIADYQACLAISPDYQLAKIALQKLGVK